MPIGTYFDQFLRKTLTRCEPQVYRAQDKPFPSLLSIMTSAIVSARIPTKDFEAVNIRAEKENVSRQAVVLKALEAYLKTPV